MAGLKLKLRPEEQILINGAIIQNGKHQVELTVKTPGTRILRLRDAIHPDEANTPTKRVCYIAQLAVAGEVDEKEALKEFEKGVLALKDVFRDNASQDIMEQALIFANANDFYKAMQYMRKLIKYEDALFARMKLLEGIMLEEHQTQTASLKQTQQQLEEEQQLITPLPSRKTLTLSKTKKMIEDCSSSAESAA